jgi:hypothetical protein
LVREFEDAEAVAIPIGAIEQGLSDAMAGLDTTYATAFRRMAALTMAAMYRRAVKG